jgi:beta-lysine N6-acetyltransferase
MFDHIMNIEDGIIHHGKENDRVYVMKLPLENQQSFMNQVEELATTNQYGKIIAKVPENSKDEFIKNGYCEEAKVLKFYNGVIDCYFLGKYLSPYRKEQKDKAVINKVLEVAHKKRSSLYVPIIDYNLEFRQMQEKDISQMILLFKKTFKTYPFPVFEEEYIKKTMVEDVIYFGIWVDDKLVGLSSSEMDIKSQNAEMTDFAIDPDYRGKNLSSILLQGMEKVMKENHIYVVYTIARALSYGMNATFSKNGYTFTGTLFNNTQISGNIESMNIWYKQL